MKSSSLTICLLGGFFGGRSLLGRKLVASSFAFVKIRPLTWLV
jgi:hypothetical protein